MAPSERGLYELHIHGRTGDGKTTLAALLCEQLDVTPEEHNFKPDNGVLSHTAKPRTFHAASIAITDNPGLMDTAGLEKDRENLVKIVDHARERGCVHALVITMNYKSDRFDSSLQDAVKLLIDSFGVDFLNGMAIVFTRAVDNKVKVRCAEKARGVTRLIAERIGMENPPNIPWYAVEAHPEDFEGFASDEKIKEIRHFTTQSVQDLLCWLRTREPISTKSIDYGEYDHQKQIRQNKEMADKAIAEVKMHKESENAARRSEAVARGEAEEHRRKAQQMEAEKSEAWRAAEQIRASSERAMIAAQQEFANARNKLYDDIESNRRMEEAARERDKAFEKAVKAEAELERVRVEAELERTRARAEREANRADKAEEKLKYRGVSGFFRRMFKVVAGIFS